jgi:sulfite reductase alpha subunit-like flavoprotein
MPEPPEPIICLPTTDERSPPPRPWPSVVHIVHDAGLAAELAEQLANSPTLPASLSVARTRCADFKRIGWASTVRHVVIFIVATEENEAPTEEAGACVRFFLRRTHAADMLADKLAYAVLGLGDSNLLLDRQTTTAKDCNQVAQKLDRRLAELGATQICARGEADDRTGNTEIDPWLRAVERALATVCAVGEHADGCADGCCDFAGRTRNRIECPIQYPSSSVVKD